MTKAEIVERVASELVCTRNVAFDLVEATFSIMKETLESGENLKVSGFGNFEVKQKEARNGRNPQTGETMTITARRVLSFRPSTVLKKAINEESA